MDRKELLRLANRIVALCPMHIENNSLREEFCIGKHLMSIGVSIYSPAGVLIGHIIGMVRLKDS